MWKEVILQWVTLQKEVRNGSSECRLLFNEVLQAKLKNKRMAREAVRIWVPWGNVHKKQVLSKLLML
jgi:hypothetical protein